MIRIQPEYRTKREEDNMEKSVTVSVLVPVYNVEEYIDKCIGSILEQDYRDFEIICVDDGSSDNSWDRLCELEKKDDRIKLIRTDHCGSAGARKAAARTAQGQWVFCVDSDDWIDDNTLSDMMSIVDEYDPDFILSGITRDYKDYSVDDKMKAEPGYYPEEKMTELKNNLVDFDHFVRFRVSPNLCNKFFRSEVIVPYLLRIPEEIMIDTDTLCAYPAVWDSKTCYVTENCYYHYRQNLNSLMNSVK